MLSCSSNKRLGQGQGSNLLRQQAEYRRCAAWLVQRALDPNVLRQVLLLRLESALIRRIDKMAMLWDHWAGEMAHSLLILSLAFSFTTSP